MAMPFNLTQSPIRVLLLSLLIVFFVGDLGFSLIQHMHQPIDGDLAEIVLPAPHFEDQMRDPLGISVLISGEKRPNPNRFFAQAPLMVYMQFAPIALQRITDPITSIYLAASLIKSAIQLTLIMLLSTAVYGRFAPKKVRFWFIASVTASLFQTFGYNSTMGIIDAALSYTFSYAWGVMLLLWCCLPWLLHVLHHRPYPQSWWFKISWPLLFVVSSLSGPLNAGVGLLIPFIFLLHWTYRHGPVTEWSWSTAGVKSSVQSMPSHFWWFHLPLLLSSAYALALGQFNSHESMYEMALLDRYMLLPLGWFKMLFTKLGWPLLLVSTGLVAALYKWSRKDDSATSKWLWWLLLFVVLYSICLPLGGYRDYRPFIIRYDTAMPVLLALIIVVGAMANRVYEGLQKRQQWLFGAWWVVLGAVFTLNDAQVIDRAACERNALEQLSVSSAPIESLHQPCHVMSWKPITHSINSKWNARLLYHWKVVDRPRYYKNVKVK